MLVTLAALSLASATTAQITGQRTLPNKFSAGVAAEVQLDLQTDTRIPNGVIVVEQLPPGWALQSATPASNSFDPASGEVRWVFFGAQVNDTGMDIRYRTIPATDPSGGERFTGTILFNDQGGNSQAVPIGGQSATGAAGVAEGDPNAPGTAGGGCAVVQGDSDGGLLTLLSGFALLWWQRRGSNTPRTRS
jgi:hypothetical protein